MLWLINLLVFTSTVLLAVLLIRLLYGGKVFVQNRLHQIRRLSPDAEESEDELQQPFMARVVRPAFAACGRALERLTPREILQLNEQKLIHAGNPANLNANSFVLLQLFTGLIFCAGGVALAVFSGLEGVRAFFIVVLVSGAGLMLPSVILNAKARRRQSEIQKTLPDMLDLLLTSVEAGLSFDMALKRVSDQKSGILSDEIKRMLEEIRMGKVREEAMRTLVRRTGVQDLSTFVGAMIQSERLGTNLAGTLRVQAGAIRQKRRQRAEQAAMKAPIKMLFPMVFLIFPALFVVLLGPTAIKLIEVFRTYF